MSEIKVISVSVPIHQLADADSLSNDSLMLISEKHDNKYLSRKLSYQNLSIELNRDLGINDIHDEIHSLELSTIGHLSGLVLGHWLYAENNDTTLIPLSADTPKMYNRLSANPYFIYGIFQDNYSNVLSLRVNPVSAAMSSVFMSVMFDQISTDTLYANDIMCSNLTASNSLSTMSLTASSVSTNYLTTDVSASIKNLSASYIIADSISAGSISGNMVADSLSVHNLTVDQAAKIEMLEAKNVDLGRDDHGLRIDQSSEGDVVDFTIAYPTISHATINNPSVDKINDTDVSNIGLEEWEFDAKDVDGNAIKLTKRVYVSNQQE